MNKIKGYFLIVLVMVVLSGGIVYGASVPMPDNIQIVPPDPSLPKELAAFPGKWEGVWYNRDSSGSLDSILIVEKIEEEKAVVVYCWGDSPEWRVRKGWRRYTADISKSDGKYMLSFESGWGVKFEFSFRGEKLEGFDNKWRNTILMKRMP